MSTKKYVFALLCASLLTACGTEQEEPKQQMVSEPVSASMASAVSASYSVSIDSGASVALSDTPASNVSVSPSPVYSGQPEHMANQVVNSGGVSPLTAAAIGYMMGSSKSNSQQAPIHSSGFNSGGYHSSQSLNNSQTKYSDYEAKKVLPKPVKREMRPAHERKPVVVEAAKDKVPEPATAKPVEKATVKPVDVKLGNNKTSTPSPNYRLVENPPKIVPVQNKKRDVVPEPAKAVKPSEKYHSPAPAPKPSLPQVSLSKEPKPSYQAPKKESSYSGSNKSSYSNSSSGYSSSSRSTYSGSSSSYSSSSSSRSSYSSRSGSRR